MAIAPGNETAGPSATDRPERYERRSGRDGLPGAREGRAGLAVEQVELVHGQLERHDVAGADAMLGVDDRDDLRALDRHVEQLLVAEVLDDVGRALDGGRGAGHLAQLEVLGPEAHDHLAAGAVERL